MNTKTAQQIAIAFKRGLAFIRGITRMAQGLRMNTKTAQQIAIAFKRGLAFICGITRMAQDADPDEKWITIGAAEGDDGKRHGGRPVCISKSTGKILKGLSKDVVGMTLSEAFKE